MEAKAETRRIVRFLAKDIDGSLPVRRALRKIPGISFMTANAILQKTGADGYRKLGDLGDEEVKKLEAFVKELEKGSAQLPKWLVNRRKDPGSGADVHAYGSGLQLKKMEDINLLKRMRAYKGIRHELGQPVRGQRTRSSFRTQKTVGVAKKKVQQAAKAQATAPKKEEGKK